MSEVQTLRSRTITWEDPTASVLIGRTISGLEYIKAIQSGEVPLPPIGQLVGMSISEVEEGRVVFTMEAAEYHYNPLGRWLAACWRRCSIRLCSARCNR